MQTAEALAARMRELEDDVDWARAQAKSLGQVKTLLLAVQQGRGNVETLAKLAAQNDIEERLERLESRASGAEDEGDDENDDEAGDA